MSYEYTVSIPAGKRAQFRAMVKQLGGRVIPKEDIPNEETIAAMKEVKSGVELETLDVESFHQFVMGL